MNKKRKIFHLKSKQKRIHFEINYFGNGIQKKCAINFKRHSYYKVELKTSVLTTLKKKIYFKNIAG